MRVLLVAGIDLSVPGGLETHVLRLARGLSDRGHDVEVQARASGAVPSEGPLPLLVERADPSRYDVVHHHGGPWPRGWDAGSRYLRTFHFSVAAKMAVYLRMGRLRTLFNPGNHRALVDERSALRRGPRHIAVSRSLREELVRFHGAARGAIEVVPNGASFDPPRVGRLGWRERHRIPGAAPLLLTIGRDDYVKGFDLLERAWARSARLPRPRPANALWVRVGGAAPAREADRITTGPVAASDVLEWIHASDAGAFPSYYEGGGIALTDMLAGGLYTLTHAVGVAPEAIRPGENGEFVARRDEAWASALARTLVSPPARVSPGLSPDWGWNEMAARVEGVYLRLLGESA